MKKYIALLLSMVIVLGSMASVLAVSAEEVEIPDAPVFKVEKPVGEKITNRKKWTATASSVFASCPPAQMLDGNTGTYWHSFYTHEGSTITSKHEAPFTVVIDMGEIRTISGIGYLPRQDQYNGNWESFEVSTSINGFSYKWVTSGSSARTKDEVTVGFGRNIEARFIKININKTNGWGYAAEFYAYGPYDNKANANIIKTTSADTTAASGKVVMRLGESSGTINEETLLLGAAPFIENGATMIPIKGLIAALGGSVDDFGDDITVNYGGVEYKLKNNSTYLTVGGVRVLLTKPTYKVDGVTMVSVLFLKDILKLNMELNQAEKAIIINL